MNPAVTDGGVPLDVLRDMCNDDDTLHAAIPTERDADDLYVLTVRTQPATEREGRVLHLRTAILDLLEGSGEWTPTGMVVPLTENLPLALGRSLVATSNTLGEDTDVLVRNGLNGGDDQLAENLLGVGEGDDVEDADDSDDADQGEASGQPEESPMVDRRPVDDGEPEVEDGTAKSASEAVSPNRGVQPSTVTCDECGNDVKRADAVNLGGALGEDLWIHGGPCPSEEDDDE